MGRWLRAMSTAFLSRWLFKAEKGRETPGADSCTTSGEPAPGVLAAGAVKSRLSCHNERREVHGLASRPSPSSFAQALRAKE